MTETQVEALIQVVKALLALILRGDKMTTRLSNQVEDDIKSLESLLRSSAQVKVDDEAQKEAVSKSDAEAKAEAKAKKEADAKAAADAKAVAKAKKELETNMDTNKEGSVPVEKGTPTGEPTQ